jgi:hypothetical protein
MTDVADITRSVVLAGLGEIPEAGGLIEAIVSVLWPTSKVDVWGEIKAQTEQAIQKDLADDRYQQVSEELVGLKTAIDHYSDTLRTSTTDPQTIKETWIATSLEFDTRQGQFKADGTGYELLLLPLLAQMANLHLALLRDGMIFGAKWGMTDDYVNGTIHSWLTKAIQDYQSWVNKTLLFSTYLVLVPTADPVVWNRQTYRRNSLIKSSADPAFYWTFFDPKLQPPGQTITARPSREIYVNVDLISDGNPLYVDQAIKPRMSYLSAWGWDRVDGFQQTFDGAAEPRTGDNGGSNVPPHGWNGAISATNPIVAVEWQVGQSGFYSMALNQIRFRFKDGSWTNVIGGNYGGNQGPIQTIGFDEHILAKITSLGHADYSGGAGAHGVVLGFRYEASY